RIEIWSDVVCPWCYIGKRRLEKALATFPHADEVELVYRAYQLDPGAPVEPTETVAEALGRKYGGGSAAGRQMVDRVEAVAAEEGMLWRHHESLRVNTVDAHRLLHLAAEHGRQAELKEALLAAYFIDAANVADHDTLVRLATGAGLDEARVREVLDGSEYVAAVESEAREAAALGANGVPFFVVDRKYGIPGAQPVEVFTQVLEKAWAEAQPKLDLVDADAEACGPEGCAL
ncbi:MAG TPA: DsbA family oxidoreductase, partial [Marmoricola sp.]|nr:DsbA family oxidoreductase [Marmoricola sp.]